MAKNSITISFRPKDEREQELKRWVEEQIGGYSSFIKSLLWKAKKEEEEELKNKKRIIPDSNNYNDCPNNIQTNSQNGLIDLSDF